jgi:hypothetical protein
MLILQAATFHLGLSSRAQPGLNQFIPSAANLFQMLMQMAILVVDNTLLHEVFPSYFTPAIFLYYGHVYYYHILRARKAAGSDVLSRMEKRCLAFYEGIGEPEAWPIAAPLIGFFYYLGAHNPADPNFSWIVPRLPNLTPLKPTTEPASTGLAKLAQVVGSQRVPIIPAMQQFLKNFAKGTSVWNDDSGFLTPFAVPLSATNSFLGLTSSAADASGFQSLAWNFAWLQPPEFNAEFGPINLTLKQNAIKRWNVPDYQREGANLDFSDLQSFLGFQDENSRYWMRQLLPMAAAFSRFFPGSTNLSMIPPLTTLGMATKVTYTGKNTASPTAVKDTWFNNRISASLSVRGYANTEEGIVDTKSAITVSPNAHFERMNPTTGRSVEPNYGTGNERSPFFVDDPDTADLNSEQFVTESEGQRDPATRFGELVSAYYDNTGRRQ